MEVMYGTKYVRVGVFSAAWALLVGVVKYPSELAFHVRLGPLFFWLEIG